MFHRHRAFIATATAAAAILLAHLAFSVETANANAGACDGAWSLGIGGLQIGLTTGTGQNSSYLDVNQRVGYNSADPMTGFNEIGRLFWRHRSACPDDHITLLGHSEGAGILHAWVTANQDVPEANAVLLSDPKRVAGPGGPGLAYDPVGAVLGFPVGEPIRLLVAALVRYPLAGVDDDFGAFPVLEVCQHDDIICDINAGWYGYLFGRAHVRYNVHADSYGNDETGVRYQ
jgi:cutinase